MSIRVFVLLAMFTFTAIVMAQTTPVPVESEPIHHLVFSNAYTRVYSVEVPVGKQTLLHHHKNDYVFVTLADAVIENIPEGQSASRVELRPGEIKFAKAPLTHVAKNIGDTPFRNYTISLLKPGDNGNTEHMMSAADAASMDMLSNNKMVVRTATLRPGASTASLATHHPHLLIGIDDIQYQTGDSADQVLRAGEWKWFDSQVTYRFTNPNQGLARITLVEFK